MPGPQRKDNCADQILRRCAGLAGYSGGWVGRDRDRRLEKVLTGKSETRVPIARVILPPPTRNQGGKGLPTNFPRKESLMGLRAGLGTSSDSKEPDRFEATPRCNRRLANYESAPQVPNRPCFPVVPPRPSQCRNTQNATASPSAPRTPISRSVATLES